jgi:two-component system OmpR family response regulator
MRVLLIGGCRLLVKALQQGLEDEGFTVDASIPGPEENGSFAVADHDAIVFDLVRPESADLSRLQRWRRAGLKVPVLVLTAPHASGDTSLAGDSGADDWLAKPFELDEFLGRLRALAPRA